MFKILWTIVLSILTSSVAAASPVHFSCAMPEDSLMELDMDIKLNVTGVISNKGDQFELEHTTSFLLGCNDEWSDFDNCWASSAFNYGKLLNDKKYKPRKYKKHMRFTLDLDSDNNFGSFEFIFPKDEIRKDKKSFEAHMIMSWVNDHFGGTAHMQCQLIDKFEKPEGAIDKKACKEKVQSMEAIVNICGEKTTEFEVFSCRQESFDKNFVCNARTYMGENSKGELLGFCRMKIEMNPTCESNVLSKITSDYRDEKE